MATGFSVHEREEGQQKDGKQHCEVAKKGKLSQSLMRPNHEQWNKVGGYQQNGESPEYSSHLVRSKDATMERTHGPQGKSSYQPEYSDREPKEKGKYIGSYMQHGELQPPNQTPDRLDIFPPLGRALLEERQTYKGKGQRNNTDRTPP